MLLLGGFCAARPTLCCPTLRPGVSGCPCVFARLRRARWARVAGPWQRFCAQPLYQALGHQIKTASFYLKTARMPRVSDVWGQPSSEAVFLVSYHALAGLCSTQVKKSAPEVVAFTAQRYI